MLVTLLRVKKQKSLISSLIGIVYRSLERETVILTTIKLFWYLLIDQFHSDRLFLPLNKDILNFLNSRNSTRLHTGHVVGNEIPRQHGTPRVVKQKLHFNDSPNFLCRTLYLHRCLYQPGGFWICVTWPLVRVTLRQFVLT